MYLLHAMFFSVVVSEELLFVETNHRLMEVAVEMGGEGASVCLSPSVSKPQTPFLLRTLTFESITLIL